jgi:hypothetical protein
LIYKQLYLTAPDDTKEQKKEEKPDTAVPTSVKTKLGARLRKDSNTQSEILKTYQKIQELKYIKSKVEKDGTWYQVQEKDTNGDIIWTGWVRSDVVTTK